MLYDRILHVSWAYLQWMTSHWRDALVVPTLHRCIPADEIDCPVHGQRYRALVDEEDITRWMDASVLEIFASALARLAPYRFELISRNRFRVYAPDDATPIAIVSERVKEAIR